MKSAQKPIIKSSIHHVRSLMVRIVCWMMLRSSFVVDRMWRMMLIKGSVWFTKNMMMTEPTLRMMKMDHGTMTLRKENCRGSSVRHTGVSTSHDSDWIGVLTISIVSRTISISKRMINRSWSFVRHVMICGVWFVGSLLKSVHFCIQFQT